MCFCATETIVLHGAVRLSKGFLIIYFLYNGIPTVYVTTYVLQDGWDGYYDE